jgi:hypothetical protein
LEAYINVCRENESVKVLLKNYFSFQLDFGAFMGRMKRTIRLGRKYLEDAIKNQRILISIMSMLLNSITEEMKIIIGDLIASMLINYSIRSSVSIHLRNLKVRVLVSLSSKRLSISIVDRFGQKAM